MESLWPSLQDKVYFIHCWRSVTSPNIVAILHFFKNWKLGKNSHVTINNFLRLTSKTTDKKLLCIILSRAFSFIPKRSWKTCIFTQKWLDNLLLMTSYLVSIVTDHLQTCLKMRARDKRTAIENLRFRCLIVYVKFQKNLKPKTPFHVRPKVKLWLFKDMYTGVKSVKSCQSKQREKPIHYAWYFWPSGSFIKRN